MILGMDIGNTSTVIGIYDENSAVPQFITRYPTEKKASWENISAAIKNQIKICSGDKDQELEKICVSSVVTELNFPFVKACLNLCEITPHFITSMSRLKIKIQYTNPEELGPDRIANAEAAHAEYRGDKLIIDLGTAMTFSVLLQNGEFDGGLIVPGTSTAIDSLALKTSNLPKIELGIPKRISAQSTKEAIKSGIFFGWISMIEGITEKLQSYYGLKFKIILTGGYSEIISKGLKLNHTLDPILTMKGIKYISDMN